MKMLRLIACSFEPLSVGDLAEAITASEHGKNRTKLALDDVRRLLVGFISERQPGVPESDQRHGSETLIVHLAHSSVLEYLMDDKANSTLAQHSEAAFLCFSRISYVRESDAGLLPYSEENDSFEISRALSPFLIYSCTRWPDHCRRAFDEDGQCPLVETTRDFILSHKFRIWNDLIRYHNSSFPYRLKRVWDKGPLAKPGFVIASFDLTELLDFSEIQALINLQDINDGNRTTLSAILWHTLADRRLAGWPSCIHSK
jgi:hypothetical protein